MIHVRRTAIAERGEMVVATRSFTARYDGELVHILAGRDRLDPRHEIVAANRDAFISERAHDERRRRAPARPSEPAPTRRVGLLEEALPKPPWLLPPSGDQGLPGAGKPQLRAGDAEMSIEIPERVLDQIEREMLRVPRDFETGGLLLGRWSSTGNGVSLLEAWGPGPHATHRRASLELAWRDDLARARRECRPTGYLVRPVGFWHVHPFVGHDKPSEGDLRMFASFHAEIRTIAPAPAFVGLIATPIERRWVRPPLAAWVVREDRAGDRFCQRGSWVCR